MEDHNRISGSMHIILVRLAYMFLVDWMANRTWCHNSLDIIQSTGWRPGV